MKRIAVIAFTEHGRALAKRLLGAFRAEGYEAEGYLPSSCAQPGFLLLVDVGALTGGLWDTADGILFIGACGIAVRAIAPNVKSKRSDPAIVVLDDGGKFAIPLLGGHIGGANALAGRVAKITGAMPVVTTATDARGVFAADSWAMDSGLFIENPEAVKEVSARLLRGEPIGLISEYPIEGALPHGIVDGLRECGIYIGSGESPFALTLRLRPKNLLLGIGCKKGAPTQMIYAAARQTLEKHGYLPQGVAGIASITLKKREPGLIAFARELGAPIRFYTAGELAAAAGAFSPSAYVKGVTGVDNVCERSCALLAKKLGGGPVIKKTAVHGVTIAAYETAFTVRFA
ncbi:MAG: cobalamin biosynthesis protein [Clostridiales bacterium]|jgi:cobalt-precorrin 5A hydrolase|nr:cobalamin biosynthesis protein [Clostridiales bacterium]